MSDVSLVFPLRLRPVLRSRQSPETQGHFVPYHAAVWIVDATGRNVLDIAPDVNDLVGGRHAENPHQLVARASRLVVWLEGLQARLTTLAASLHPESMVLVRPVLQVSQSSRTAEIGFSLISPPSEEFDRVTKTVDLHAGDDAVDAVLDRLSHTAGRRLEAAVHMLLRLQEAIDSWRSVEEVAASSAKPLRIDDVTVES